MAGRRDVLDAAGGQRALAVVSEGEASRGAEAELLGLVVEHLARCHPSRFALGGEGEGMVFHSLHEGLSWRLAEHHACPVALVGQLVQEDVCLMRAAPRGGGRPPRHLFVAGAVLESFDPVDKHMLPMLELHRPVPGYAEDLGDSMDRAFHALRRPLWRANFSFMEWREEGESEDLDVSDQELLERVYIKVEYETLRRLPQHSDHLVFTIRPHVCPVTDFAAAPRACAALAAELRGLSAALLEYRGFARPSLRRVVLGFLDAVSAQHGLP